MNIQCLLLEWLIDLLPYILTVTIFLCGVFAADRGRYIHGFREHDIEIFKALRRLSTVRRVKDKEFYLSIAKMHLKVSEDYRRTAVYNTFACTYMLLAMIMFAIAQTVLFITRIKYVLPFTIFGMFLAFLSVASYIGRYHIIPTKISNLWLLYMKISWRLSEVFYFLAPSHLRRWNEVGKLIKQYLWADLTRLEEYKDIAQVYPEWGDASEEIYKNKQQI